MKTFSLAAVAFGTAAFFVAPAQAANVIVESQQVDLSKYNLNHQSGAEAALTDIAQAAAEVCGSDRTMPGRHFEVIAHRKCVDAAIGKAVSDSGSTVLSQIYQSEARG